MRGRSVRPHRVRHAGSITAVHSCREGRSSGRDSGHLASVMQAGHVVEGVVLSNLTELMGEWNAVALWGCLNEAQRPEKTMS